jgi:hypothetical protein
MARSDPLAEGQERDARRQLNKTQVAEAHVRAEPALVTPVAAPAHVDLGPRVIPLGPLTVLPWPWRWARIAWVYGILEPIFHGGGAALRELVALAVEMIRRLCDASVYRRQGGPPSRAAGSQTEPSGWRREPVTTLARPAREPRLTAHFHLAYTSPLRAPPGAYYDEHRHT